MTHVANSIFLTPRGVLAALLAIAVVTAGLAAFRAEALFDPPYEDQAVGIWWEGDFLAATNFDYLKLRYDEPHYNDEVRGARSYMISIVATFIAILLKLVPDRDLRHLVAHLAYIACAAMVVVVVARRLASVCGWPSALLLAAAIVVVPCFTVQIDMLGMDMPMVAMSVASAAMALDRRWAAGAWLSGAGFLFKPTGMLLTLAGLTYLFLLGFVGEPDPRRRRNLLAGWFWYLLVLFLEVAIYVWGDPLPEQRRSIGFPSEILLPRALLLVPDLAAAMVLLAAASLAALAPFGREAARLSWQEVREKARVALDRPEVAITVLGWIVVLGMLASMLTWVAVPRYFTVAVPFLALMVGALFFSAPGNRRWAASAVALFIAVEWANRSGQLAPSIETLASKTLRRQAYMSARACALTERDLDYRRQHADVIRAMRAIEANFPGEPVLTPHPYHSYLRRPTLGYVRHPVEVHDATDFSQAMESFKALCWPNGFSAPATPPILIRADISRITLPPPEPGDEIIGQTSGPDAVVIYRKRPPSWIREDATFTRWYLSETAGGDWRALRALFRAPVLERWGEREQLLAEVNRALIEDPGRDDLQKALLDRRLSLVADPRPFAPELLGEIGKGSGAPARWPTLMRESASWASWLAERIDGKETPRPTDALSPAAAAFVEGALDTLSGHLDAAERKLFDAATRRPDFAEAWAWLGVARAQQRRLDAARTAFERALSDDPSLAAAERGLGAVDGQAGDWRKARVHLARSYLLDPEDPESRGAFARAMDLLSLESSPSGSTPRAEGQQP